MSFSAGVNAAYGAYHAMNYKRPRLEDDTMTGQSFSQQTTAVKKMASGTEYGDSRRAKSYTVRLHPAKYLKCDPLMKELFFPILTMAHKFGLCSTTGFGNMTAGKQASGALVPEDIVSFSKAGGCYRGIAAFTIRSQAISDSSVNKLNTVNQNVGSTMITGSSRNIISAYRRFNNGPQYISGTNSGQPIVNSAPPTRS